MSKVIDNLDGTKTHFVKPHRDAVIEAMAHKAAHDNDCTKIPNGFGVFIVAYQIGFKSCHDSRDKEVKDLVTENEKLKADNKELNEKLEIGANQYAKSVGRVFELEELNKILIEGLEMIKKMTNASTIRIQINKVLKSATP